MIINDYFEFDNNKLYKTLKNYIKKNPCCEQFPKCVHPIYQSDLNLFKIEDNDINIIKNNYFTCLLKMLNKNELNIIQNKVWAYLTLKNENTQSIWHRHLNIDDINNNNNINISGLLYISETKIGTEFKTEFLNFEIIPHTNRWFLWDSSILHRPKNMISEEDRIVIATSTILKK
jgi:hypothetical protein